MSCDNKPPMTVWLAFDAVDCFDRNEDCGASDLKNHHHHIGPYVDLEQFMAEVNRRADEIDTGGYGVGYAEYLAMKIVAKEIMEGKA